MGGVPETNTANRNGYDSMPYADDSPNAIELRILLRELFFIGPVTHTWEGESNKHDVEMLQSDIMQTERAAKVCYRRRPCEAQVPSNYAVVVVPRESFAALSAALEHWCAAMPPAH